VFILSLAWKNLSRYRKRTIITASAIAFGLAVYIFMDGWLKGAETESERNLVLYETSSSRIVTREYWADRQRMPLASAIEEPEAVITALRAAGIRCACTPSRRGDRGGPDARARTPILSVTRMSSLSAPPREGAHPASAALWPMVCR
jgi:hypothetical protein